MTRRRREEDDWIFDPGLAALSRNMQRELREEAEEVESIVAESELRERTMQDVASEARNRGDMISIATSRRTFNGIVVYAGKDFVSVRTESFEVDVNLADAAYIRTVEPGRRGGQARTDGPGTFEMRMIERKSPRERVEIGYRRVEETVIGFIASVGQDHVVLIDDMRVQWTIPLGAISWVIRTGRRPR
jgi:hypothetical protein